MELFYNSGNDTFYIQAHDYGVSAYKNLLIASANFEVNGQALTIKNSDLSGGQINFGNSNHVIYRGTNNALYYTTTGIGDGGAFHRFTGSVITDSDLRAERFRNVSFYGSNQANARNHFVQYNSGASAAAAGWIAAAFGDINNGKVVIGQYDQKAVIGAHDGNLTAWNALYLRASDSGDNLILNTDRTVTIPNIAAASSDEIVTVDNTGKLKKSGVTVSSGTVTATNFAATSDLRLKANLQPINHSLIYQLNGYHHGWKDQDGRDYGLIAQEVEKYYPELVMSDDKGMKSVNYMKLVPIMLEAMKKMKFEIETLKG